MIKTTLYTYLGTNGTLTSPIHLEGIYSVRSIRLDASNGKVLTKDGVNTTKSVTVPEAEADKWMEIEAPTGQK